MTLKATGAGKFRVDGTSVLLFNFDIDGTRVKDEHKAALEKEVVPEIKGRPGLRNYRHGRPLGRRRLQPRIIQEAHRRGGFRPARTRITEPFTYARSLQWGNESRACR